jgi:putative nucleotidyltransferase with HDIG domain
MNENTVFLGSLIDNKIINQGVLDYLISKNDNDAFALLIELSQNPSIDRQRLGTLWGNSINIAHADLNKTIINSDILKLIPEEFARKHKVIALYKFADVITIAVTNPKNVILLDKIEKITNTKVSPLFAFPDNIDKILDKHYKKEDESLTRLTEKFSKSKPAKTEDNVAVTITDTINKYDQKTEFDQKSVISEKVKKYWIDNTKSILCSVAEGQVPSTKVCTNLSNSIIEEVHNKIDLVQCVNQLRISDEYTYSHCVNTAVLCSVFAKEFSFGEKPLKEITLGAMLHDLGKMRIPKVILYKPDKLSKDEMDIVKRHPELGYKMIRQMDVPEIVAEMAYNHHEKINGSGYPRKLTENQLSVFDQVLAIIDVYDALISDRPYKKAIPFHQAINILYLEGKTSFNNAFLYKFVELVYYKNTESLKDEFKTIFFNR